MRTYNKSLFILNIISLFLLIACEQKNWIEENDEFSFEEEEVSLSLSEDDQIVLMGEKEEVIKEGISLQITDGNVVNIVGLSDYQYIELNGLKVENGKVKIFSKTPKFISEGILIIDDLCKCDTIKIPIRLAVNFFNGKQIAYFTRDHYANPRVPCIDCFHESSGFSFNSTLRNGLIYIKTPYKTNQFNSYSQILKIPFNNKDSLVLSKVYFSDTENPPGFRFALIFKGESEHKQYFAFVDDSFMKK